MKALDIKNRLLEVIDALSESQLTVLLDRLEESGGKRMSNQKETVLTPTGVRPENSPGRNCVKDINARGLFIETPRSLSAGKEISITLIPDSLEGGLIKMTGQIIRCGPHGFGIKFCNERPDQITKGKI